MRKLMRYVPRRYDPAIIEALALGGALTPELDRSEREARLSAAVHWMDVNDTEGKWTGRISAEGGFHFERLWRGVTDHHLIEATCIGRAEARNLQTMAMEKPEKKARPN